MGEEARGSQAHENFEQIVMPHLDAAYNLARWLVRNPHDAEDVAQEAFLRAFRFFSGYHGGDARAWILAIVRNTAYSFLEKNRPVDFAEEFDEEVHKVDFGHPEAEMALLRSVDAKMLQGALDRIPVNFREVLILRELEEMSYKQIAEVMSVPVGTVMSGLARARTKLREQILRTRDEEEQRGLRK
jgi:RNA polymerase sigma-70 factor (ECF subfamily)